MMTNRKLSNLALAVLAVLVVLFLAACGDGDAALSPTDVEEIVRSEFAEALAPEQVLTTADVEEAIRRAMVAMPQREAGLNRDEVKEVVMAAISAMTDSPPALTTTDAERIARGVLASIPPRSASADYTKFFVDNAISMYETQGLDPTLAYYNRPESIDGQWYVFIIDDNDLVVGHPDPQRLGLDLKGWVGTDANGYNFGPEMLSATEEGKWVSYVYKNPQTGSISPEYLGDVDLKNAWVVRHGGLLFGSGWYINADEFTESLVATAARVFGEVGLEGTIAYFASPEIAFGGLAAVIAYYNSSENVEGAWFAFIADESGTIIDHYRKEMVGKSLEEVLGTDTFEATADGNWVTTEDVRVWVLGQDGMTFGSGWQSGHDESN